VWFPCLLGTVAAVMRDGWYTTGDIARLVGVTDRTVANWARAGALPHSLTPGGHRRFLKIDVERFLAERNVRTGREVAGSHP
jgi:excisionase family DNA binding protein